MTNPSKFKISAAIAAALMCAGAANAQSKDDTFKVDKLPAPLQVAVSGGLKVEKSFPAEGGLTGWVLSQGVGQNVILFTPPSGDVALAGNLLDAKGQNLTKKYLEEHAPKVDYSKMWGLLEKSTWVAEGAKDKDAKSVIYVFKDANCSFCHLAWKALQAYEKVGLQVRWVPVAFLAPDSYDKGAALINSKNANTALADLHSKWGTKYSTAPASQALRDKMDANNKLMNEWGFRGTPATLYKDSSGKVQAVSGMFPLSQLPEITGLPEQPQDDPALARFK